jgi:arginine/lysine/ornithine decarboxylase
MTQTALIHISGCCPGRERIRKMLSVFMTSSPSYVLMSSIDSLTDLLTKRGAQLFDAYEKRLDDLYRKVGDLENLSILCKEKLTAAGSGDFDRSKIVISDTTGNFTGVQLAAALKNSGIYVEMAASSYVVLMTSIADTDEGFSRLYDALIRINEQIASKISIPEKRNPIKRLWDRFVGKRIAGKLSLVSPGCDISHRIEITEHENKMKAALFDDSTEYIPVELAEGRTSKDMVSIYPPGIPVIVPGEKITGEDVDTILSAIADGLEIKGLKEKEIAVLWEKSST